MFNVLSANFTAQQKATKKTSTIKPELTFSAKLNTGQLVKDTISFSSRPDKKALRQQEAEELQIPQKYKIPIEEVTYHHIKAVKAGLSPEAEPYQVKAVQIGLNPYTTTQKEVEFEPIKRSEEISAKIDSIIFGIDDTNIDYTEIQAIKKQILCDLTLEVAKEVLGKVPEDYLPTYEGDFEKVLPHIDDTVEFIDFVSEEVLGKSPEEGLGNLTRERKGEIQTIFDKRRHLRKKLYSLLSDKIDAINPILDSDKYYKEIKKLKISAPNMKRADFERELNNLSKSYSKK